MRHPSRVSDWWSSPCCATPVHAGAQRDRQMGGIGMTVWEDTNYRGSNHTFIDDTPDLRSVGMDNQISSLRVASGQLWQVCDGYNYTGRCQVFSDGGVRPATPGVERPDLVGAAAAGTRPGSDPARTWPTRPRAVRRDAGTPDSASCSTRRRPTSGKRNFSDRAMSVRVPRGEVWELCVNINYDDCRIVDGDVPNLDAIQMSRLITSARPRPGRSGGGGGVPAGGGRPRLILYERAGYAGRAITIDGSEPALRFLDDLNGSARVVGRWELCDAPRFGGQCVTLTRDVRDLRTLNLRDRVASARPRRRKRAPPSPRQPSDGHQGYNWKFVPPQMGQ